MDQGSNFLSGETHASSVLNDTPDSNVKQTCMICMTDIVDRELVLPNCTHAFHVACALTAIQYDNRCPICRVPSVVARNDDATDESGFSLIESSFEELRLRQDSIVRSYQRRKSRYIQKSVSLSKLKFNLKTEKTNLRVIEQDIDKFWFKMQKEMWSNDANIRLMKNERKKRMRKVRYLEKRMFDRIVPVLGDEPAPF